MNTPKELLSAKYEEVVTKASDIDGQTRSLAYYREMPGCYFWGDHPDYALWGLRKIRELYIHELHAADHELSSLAVPYDYELTLTREHANVLGRACELFARIQLGQFDRLSNTIVRGNLDLQIAIEERLRFLAAEATGLPSGSSHGIGSNAIRDSARIAYDIFQVVRHKLSTGPGSARNNSGMDTMPLRWSATMDLPYIRSTHDDTVELLLTERQAEIAMDATELLGRLYMGQFGSAADVWLFGQMKPQRNRYRLLKDEIVALGSTVTGLRLGAYWGIRSPEVPDDGRVAWDIHQTVRHHLAWDRTPEGGSALAFAKPWRLSALPLPQIRRAAEPYIVPTLAPITALETANTSNDRSTLPERTRFKRKGR